MNAVYNKPNLIKYEGPVSLSMSNKTPTDTLLTSVLV